MKSRKPDHRVFAPFKNMRLKDYDPANQSQEAAKHAVEMYLANLDNAMATGLGLTFIGPPGVGKTMLSCIVLNEAMALDFSVKSTEMSSWIRLHHRKFETARGIDDPEVHAEWWATYREIEAYRRKIQFFLLDDVGKEYDSGSGWSQSMFDDFIRYRHNRGLCTLLTTNLGLPLWAPRYSDSMESFLHQSSTVITIEGSDWRKR